MDEHDTINCPRFSEFAKDHVPMTGEKTDMSSILNQEIVVTGYKIGQSKFKDDSYLSLQIRIAGEEKILFTGSSVLRDQVKQYKDHIPFRTKIMKLDRFYTFT